MSVPTNADVVAAIELKFAEGNRTFCLPIKTFDTFKVQVFIEKLDPSPRFYYAIHCVDIEQLDYSEMDENDRPDKMLYVLANSIRFAGTTGTYSTVAASYEAVLEFLQTAHFNKFDGMYQVTEVDERNNAKVLCAKVLEGALFKRVKTNVSECCVCHEPTQTRTQCYHFVCVSCISQLDCSFTNAGHMRKCPMCRADFGIVKSC